MLNRILQSRRAAVANYNYIRRQNATNEPNGGGDGEVGEVGEVGADGEVADGAAATRLDEDCQLRDEVRRIMANVVTASSAKRYVNGIVNFFMWSFDDESLHCLFKDWFLVKMSNDHDSDLSLPENKRKSQKNL